MERSIGLFGATGVGVGAIVGGGILALAGVAFATAGPGAILAFALNGLIAVLTALSFAELSTQFPESGGTYTFAKKVLSVEAAFTVGWVVWFASIVAGVLYAYGFGAFAVIAIARLWEVAFGSAPAWLTGHVLVVGLAIVATALYAFGLTRRGSGSGHGPSIGKVVAFVILIAGGLWALAGRPAGSIADQLRPFFPGGALGLFRAMGYTFIALQGFDLIAAVAGEVRDPVRIIPRAMLLSLGIALAIYLPFLLVTATVGMEPGMSVQEAGAAHPEAVVALAARNYLGPFGYWLVIVAAVLSMLSALQANLLAASRIALAMARDRTLPYRLEILNSRYSTPVAAVLITAAIIVLILLVVPDVAAIGAASSLIFLITFALVHRIDVMARRRGGVRQPYFRLPFFPLIPAAGATACVALAVFQGISVPVAGLIAMVWLALGGVLYSSLFSRRARAVDASSQALDADLVRLRGRNPLVLVPIANPATAEAMVGIANALAPPRVGRVLLLSVVAAPEEWEPGTSPQALLDAQAVLGNALTASFARGLAPEALTTVAAQPWPEIARVARSYGCESLVLGFSNLATATLGPHLERLMGTVDCDVVVLRAPLGWRLRDVRRILVPLAGRGDHEELRARLLGSLHRSAARESILLQVLPPQATERECDRARQELARIARDEVPGKSRIVVAQAANVAEEVARHAAESDLVVLGLQRLGRRQKMFGDVVLRVARDTSCPILMISRRG